MSEQVKMSDVFNLLKYANGKEIDTGDLIDSRGNWWATFNSKQAAMHAAIAIKSYDQHIEIIAKKAEQIKILREAVGFASIALSECANELNCFIDMKNSDLESSVTSCTENQPDYFDAQTVHESMVVVNNLQKALSATEQK